MAKNDNKDLKKKNSHYFKDMKAELKKVVWPSKKQTSNNTVAVIVFALILAIIVFLLDLCFDTINKHGITPLQEKITSSLNTTDNNTSSEEENEDTSSEENKDENVDDNSSEANVEATTESEENNNTATETNTESNE